MIAPSSSLKRSLVASIAFHGGIVIAAYVTLPNLKNDLATDDRVIVVEMVEIAETTNAPPPSPEPEPEPEAKAEPEPPPPAPEPTPTPDAAEEPVPVPDPNPDPAPPVPEPEVAALPPRPEPETEPEVVEPEPEPEPVPTPEVKPEPEPKPVPETKVAKALNEMKPVQKPKPPPPPDPMASILKTLEELKVEPPAPESETEPETKTAAEPSFDDQIAEALMASSTKKHDVSKPISISTIEAVRERLKPCWNFQAGAKNADELTVAIRVYMNPDATVSNAEVIDAERMLTDNLFRIAAETALRAVRNPKCQPFPLPAEQYQQWRSMTLNFDPSQML